MTRPKKKPSVIIDYSVGGRSRVLLDDPPKGDGRRLTRAFQGRCGTLGLRLVHGFPADTRVPGGAAVLVTGGGDNNCDFSGPPPSEFIRHWRFAAAPDCKKADVKQPSESESVWNGLGAGGGAHPAEGSANFFPWPKWQKEGMEEGAQAQKTSQGPGGLPAHQF